MEARNNRSKQRMVHSPRSKKIVNWDILFRREGSLKVIEMVFGGVCLGLACNYGIPVWLNIGTSLPLFITTCASFLMNTLLLTLTYMVSNNSYNLVKQSILEVIFNVAASLLYLASSIFLLINTILFLWPFYVVTPYFQAYPALMAASVIGMLGSFVHGIDGICAFRSKN